MTTVQYAFLPGLLFPFPYRAKQQAQPRPKRCFSPWQKSELPGLGRDRVQTWVYKKVGSVCLCVSLSDTLLAD